MAYEMEQKRLFGGAITASLPKGFVDVSDLRQVPDNQEVFVHRDSNVSIVIEVLQRVSEPDDLKAVKFHFEALAHDNDALSSTMQPPFVKHIDQSDQPSPIILQGSQRVRKFNASVPDDVGILIALFRVQSGGKGADLVVSESIPRGANGGLEDKPAALEFVTMVASLRIVDYGLFC